MDPQNASVGSERSHGNTPLAPPTRRSGPPSVLTASKDPFKYQLTLIKVIVTTVPCISLDLQLPLYRGMNDGNTAGGTPPSVPLHTIANGPHGLSQQSIKQPI